MTCGNFFLLRGLSFSWCLELIQRYGHHESKSVQLVVFSPPHAFYCVNWYFWIFCEWILLKWTLFSSESLSSHHKLTKFIKNMFPASFQARWDASACFYPHRKVHFLQWTSHSPESLKVAPRAASLQGHLHHHHCAQLQRRPGKQTLRATLSPHQVNGLIFVKDSIARPLLTQEL